MAKITRTPGRERSETYGELQNAKVLLERAKVAEEKVMITLKEIRARKRRHQVTISKLNKRMDALTAQGLRGELKQTGNVSKRPSTKPSEMSPVQYRVMRIVELKQPILNKDVIAFLKPWVKHPNETINKLEAQQWLQMKGPRGKYRIIIGPHGKAALDFTRATGLKGQTGPKAMFETLDLPTINQEIDNQIEETGVESYQPSYVRNRKEGGSVVGNAP